MGLQKSDSEGTLFEMVYFIHWFFENNGRLDGRKTRRDFSLVNCGIRRHEGTLAAGTKEKVRIAEIRKLQTGFKTS